MIRIIGGEYRFGTYTNDNESNITDLRTNIAYDPNYLTSWTYIYFGYSRPLK